MPPEVGQLCTGTEPRDAIHIAMIPCKAEEPLKAGDEVAFIDGEQRVGKALTTDGIVDPFLQVPVNTGDWCWIWLRPNTITNLRHHWTHPSVSNTDDAARASVRWMTDYAHSLDYDYEEIMMAARAWLESGDHLYGGSALEGEYIPLEFWTHYERITGTIVSADQRQDFFRCAC